MENKQVTVSEVLEMTIRNLFAVSVPVEYIEQIGMPISMAVGNLKECVRAMKEAEQAAQQMAPEEMPDNVIDLGEIDADADDAEPVTD